MRELEGTAREILVSCCALDDNSPVSLSSCRACEYFNLEFSDNITCLFDPEQMEIGEDYCGSPSDMYHRDRCAQEEPFDFA